MQKKKKIDKIHEIKLYETNNLNIQINKYITIKINIQIKSSS